MMFRRIGKIAQKARPAVLAGAWVLLLGGAAVAAVYRPPAPHVAVTVASRVNVSPTASLSPKPTSESSSAPQIAGASTTSRTQASQQPVSAPVSTPTPQPVVNLRLIVSGNTQSFQVPVVSGDDACSILATARSVGQLDSVTMHYYTTMQEPSYYVDEINGYKNNWAVKVNNVSPRGCSLIKLNPGDVIEWRFG